LRSGKRKWEWSKIKTGTAQQQQREKKIVGTRLLHSTDERARENAKKRRELARKGEWKIWEFRPKRRKKRNKKRDDSRTKKGTQNLLTGRNGSPRRLDANVKVSPKVKRKKKRKELSSRQHFKTTSTRQRKTGCKKTARRKDFPGGKCPSKTCSPKLASGSQGFWQKEMREKGIRLLHA